MDNKLLLEMRAAGKKMMNVHRTGTWAEFEAAREEYRAARTAFCTAPISTQK